MIHMRCICHIHLESKELSLWSILSCMLMSILHECIHICMQREIERNAMSSMIDVHANVASHEEAPVDAYVTARFHFLFWLFFWMHVGLDQNVSLCVLSAFKCAYMGFAPNWRFSFRFSLLFKSTPGSWPKCWIFQCILIVLSFSRILQSFCESVGPHLNTSVFLQE